MASEAPRDGYFPEFKKKTSRPAPLLPRQEFKYSRSQPNAPVFRPDGRFDALRESGILSDPRTLPGEGARDTMREKKYRMPGYTGYIRGSQHISGRTYGEMTRRAYDTNYDEHLRTSPIPSGPQGNRKVPNAYLRDTFVTNNLSDRHNHVPGYTGHVPGVRATYSKTFGESTMQEMKRFGETYSRPDAMATQQAGMASTIKPRQLLTIDSAPLPGTTYVTEPPAKMIPGNLKYLRFFAM